MRRILQTAAQAVFPSTPSGIFCKAGSMLIIMSLVGMREGAGAKFRPFANTLFSLMDNLCEDRLTTHFSLAPLFYSSSFLHCVCREYRKEERRVFLYVSFFLLGNKSRFSSFG